MTAICPTGLIPISLATLTHNTMLGVDIYLKSSQSAIPVLFCPGEESPGESRLRPLVSGGITKLFIDRSDREKYQLYLRENWQDLLADETHSMPSRMAVMSEVIRDVLSDEFRIGDTSAIVEASISLGAGTAQLLGDRPLLTNQLCHVLHHDYATFTHCTNVSMYCVTLARELGFRGAELEEIAAGGLLHDLGKLQIDERILTKPGRLDEFEFREIKKHPVTGFSELVERDDVTLGQLMMTYQHHERLDGSGYPVGILGEEIHTFAKICAIVDVYEALTSQRPYREPMSTKTALAVLEKGHGTEFDQEMLQCWRALITQK